jgi:transglutaminase-like putative cysteine protease
MLNRLKIEEGWLTFLLAWALVMTTALAILNAELIAGLELMPIIATSGVVIGLILAKSHFPARSAHSMAIVYGLFFLIYLIGRDLPVELTWRERVFDLLNRQSEWIGKAVSQGSSRDGLIFVMHTSAIFWLLGYTASWYTFRRPRLWLVILPSGLVLLSIVYYYYGPKPLAGFLVIYTLLALIYIARTHLGAQEKKWRAETVRFETGLRFNFLQASLFAALIVLGISWGLPSAKANSALNNAFSQSAMSETWRDFQDSWTRLFSSLRTYGTGTNDAFRNSLSLGGPRSIASTLIMDIFPEERLPYVYWKAVSYDEYQDGTWTISDSDSFNHLPDEGEIPIESTRMRKEVVQTIVNYVPNAGTIYSAPDLLNSDLQIVVNHSLDDAGNIVVHSAMSRLMLRQGERYRVVSDYSIADATSLRQASQEYPEWIMDKYLQTPDTLTTETITLAKQLSDSADNSFDKAISIRNYLRRNITYNDQIEAPPEGVEPIHYILFQGQEAYCNYYASAMTMMLRSQGVPARFVAGYTQGEWDEETGSYRVRAKNAHAWVEVYFPDFGWIPFEPTASIPSGDRPESAGNPGDAFGVESTLEQEQALIDELAGNDEDPLARRDLLGEDQSGFSGRLSTRRFIQIAGAVALLGGAIAIILIARELNWRIETDVDKSYSRLGNWARFLGLVFRPALTPNERADLLARSVPEGKEPIYNLTDQYVRQRFSRRREMDAGFKPAREWQLLRPKLVRRVISYQLKHILKGIRKG